MITFRPVVAGDLTMLHRWLNDPAVVRWWEGDDVSWAGVIESYGDTSRDPEDHYIALHRSRPFGWIQCCALADVPEDAEFFAPLGLDDSAASIDYLIGEPQDRGHGLGTAMVAAFIADVVFGQHPAWTQICVAPQEANEASWRTLAAVGFRRIGTLQDDRFGPCQAMLLDRPSGGSMGA